MSLLFRNTFLNKNLSKYIDTEVQTNSYNNNENIYNNFYLPNVINNENKLFENKLFENNNSLSYNYNHKNKLKTSKLKNQNSDKKINKKNYKPISLKYNNNSIDYKKTISYNLNLYNKNNILNIKNNNDKYNNVNNIKSDKINDKSIPIFSNSYIIFNIFKQKKNLENLENTFINNHKNNTENNNIYYMNTIENSYNNNYRSKKYKKFIIPKKIRTLNLNQKNHDINLFNHLNIYKDYNLKYIENAHKIDKIIKNDDFLNKIKKDQLNLKFNNKIKYFN